MEIIKRHKVYSLNKILGNKNHLSLEEVVFDLGTYNEFSSEEEAIQALIKDNKTYEDFIILSTVFLRPLS